MGAVEAITASRQRFASTPKQRRRWCTDFSDTYSGTNASYWNSSTLGVWFGYFVRSGDPLERFCAGSCF